MFSRRAFMTIAAFLAGAGLAGKAQAAPFAPASMHRDPRKKHHVAYHLSEEHKVHFVLGNIHNHVRGVGGPENVEIVLVVHGPALRSFDVMSGDQGALEKLERLRRQAGLSFRVCGNTMKTLHIAPEDLPPGTIILPQGGVTHLMELQEAGFAYLRP